MDWLFTELFSGGALLDTVTYFSAHGMQKSNEGLSWAVAQGLQADYALCGEVIGGSAVGSDSERHCKFSTS